MHGYYWHYPRDLSWVGEATRVWVRVKRFDCCHPACRKATISENFSTFLAPHAHRTGRLKTQQGQMGRYVGGGMGATLFNGQNTPSSADSVSRTVKALELPQHPTPRVLGVDDWAFRKGHHYGTVLVYLERKRVVDLLPDRTTASLKTWLEQHPGVEVVTRDCAPGRPGGRPLSPAAKSESSGQKVARAAEKTAHGSVEGIRATSESDPRDFQPSFTRVWWPNLHTP